jgi:hypothetical protein
VKVHITTSAPGVQLLGTEVSKLEPAGDGAFRSLGPSTILCMAPCDTYVDARVGQPLYVTSPDIPDSQSFQLYQYEGDVNLDVAPGNGVMLGFGAVSSTLGLVGILVGVPMLIVGATNESSDIEVVGGVTTAVSSVLFGAGIGLSFGGSTDVEIVPATALGASAASTP